MNFIFGSANGIGKSLYSFYKKNNYDVFGFDKESSNTTDFVIDLSKDINTSKAVNIINKENIDSLTYAAGIQSGKNIESIYNVNVLSFIKIIQNTISNYEETAVCAISSVHAISSNYQNLEYSSSKASLEAAIKSFSTKGLNSFFYFLRLGATETNLLKNNVKDLEKLKKDLPSGNLFQPDDVAALIFDINTNHKHLMNGGFLQIDQGVLSRLSTE